MEVEELAIPTEEAEEEFQALREAFKTNAKLKKEEIRQDLKKVYGHLRHGKKIIDIYESFKKAGLNEAGDPKLAICRADAKTCFLSKRDEGGAVFSISEIWRHDPPRKTYNDVALPEGSFTWKKNDYGSILNPECETLVPIIPARILVAEVKVLLKNFHILWEVEEWKPIPPKDPILLKQLTPNLFGVLATWDLTKLERAVIRGRIQL